MPVKVKIIPPDELSHMTTAALLSRRSKLLQCEESLKASDRYMHENAPSPEQSGYVEFKDQKLWKTAYNEIKKALSGREHVPTAAERKARRHEQTRKKYR